MWLGPYRDNELVGPCASCGRLARQTCQRCGAPVCERDMLSAWDACYECDAIIQEAARGDLPNPSNTLETVGVAASVIGYVTMLLLMPVTSVVGAFSLVGGLTALAVQRRRTRRYRKSIVDGELPLPGRTRWLLTP